ncbi:hypothetical protein [Nocardia sp. CA-290969]|uniref:hypothetical protein n=1 Tax=Nocardia sp. CA-290969 TaxID=3239986 RepID=UPI003D89CA84
MSTVLSEVTKRGFGIESVWMIGLVHVTDLPIEPIGQPFDIGHLGGNCVLAEDGMLGAAGERHSTPTVVRGTDMGTHVGVAGIAAMEAVGVENLVRWPAVHTEQGILLPQEGIVRG